MIPANKIADVTIAAILSKAIPTWQGVVNGLFHVKQLHVPKKYHAANNYFSVLLSWGLFVMCVFILGGIVFYKKVLGYRGSRP